MANLARKLPPGSLIHVHDVVEAALDDIRASFPQSVVKMHPCKGIDREVGMSQRTPSPCRHLSLTIELFPRM